MALFKLLRGLETNLSTAVVDGQVYFCKDTQNFYIDCGDTRYKIAAKYADKLRYVADGSTVEIDPSTILTDSNYATKIGVASSSKAGLMTAADKDKLDGIAAGATKTIVDEALSATSTNPVQNKVIKDALDKKAGLDVATAASAGLMSAEDKATLDNLVAVGGEVNQNAFSNVTVAGTKIAATAKTDNISVVAGDNITLTPDAANKQYTISAKDTTYNAASADADGLMSKADKAKLDGISAEANKYVHATHDSHAAGMYKITVDSEGHVSNATAISKGDITALGIPAQDTTYDNATTGEAGLMSAADKAKLDSVAEGATNVVVDSALNDSSANAIQNKVVKAALDGKSDVDHTHDYIPNAEKGTANGVATLGADGKVPSTQLPSYVDDVLEFANKDAFPATGESGKIYVALDTNLTYRWGGTAYVEISQSLAIGTNENTAAAGNHIHDAATQTANGFMSAADKEKLDGISAGANKYVHASHTVHNSGLYKVTVDAEGHVSNAVAVTKGDITGLGIPAQDTTYGDATTGASGLMSAADKKKLDSVAEGANKTTVDSALSDSSTNPVQNKIVKAAIDAKANKTHEHTEYENQNAFSSIKVGATTIAADNATDTVEIAAGDNVTITPDAAAGKIVIAATDTTYDAATTTADGLMSASDKAKLNGIAEGATKTIVDAALSNTSTNPVQNKVIYDAISWIEF